MTHSLLTLAATHTLLSNEMNFVPPLNSRVGFSSSYYSSNTIDRSLTISKIAQHSKSFLYIFTQKYPTNIFFSKMSYSAPIEALATHVNYNS